MPAPHPSPGKSPEVGPDSALSPAQDLTIFVMPPGKAGCGPHLDPAKVTYYTRDIQGESKKTGISKSNGCHFQALDKVSIGRLIMSW